jgi:hypothetical protein
VYIPSKRLVIKTSFIKIIEPIGPVSKGLPRLSIGDNPLEGENDLEDQDLN